MHPDRGIVHTDRNQDGLYMKPDVPNTLTHQYAATNNASKDPL